MEGQHHLQTTGKPILFLIAFAVSGLCGCKILPLNPQPVPSPSFTPIPSFTATTRPTNSTTATQLPTPSATPTSTPFAPFIASVWADGVNLRSNPGYLFEVRANLPKNTPLLVLGRCLGDEWMYVRIPSGIEGWIFAQLLTSDIELSDAPLLEPGPSQRIIGQVLDQAGEPVSGIQFALIKGPGDTPPRTDAVTGPDGWFYAFLPLNVNGNWNIYYTAIACTSNVMNENCDCKSGICGRPYPSDLIITLPYHEPLTFIWK